MPADERFVTRPFRDGDEETILDLFARSFPHAPRSLEHSGFEIVSVAPAVEYRDHKFIRHRLSRHPAVAAMVRPLLKLLPDPLPVSAGSIRVVARRRGGARIDIRAIRSIEPTHAR